MPGPTGGRAVQVAVQEAMAPTMLRAPMVLPGTLPLEGIFGYAGPMLAMAVPETLVVPSPAVIPEVFIPGVITETTPLVRVVPEVAPIVTTEVAPITEAEVGRVFAPFRTVVDVPVEEEEVVPITPPEEIPEEIPIPAPYPVPEPTPWPIVPPKEPPVEEIVKPPVGEGPPTGPGVPPPFPFLGLPRFERGGAVGAAARGTLFGGFGWTTPGLFVEMPDPFGWGRQRVAIAKKKRKRIGGRRVRATKMPSTGFVMKRLRI